MYTSFFKRDTFLGKHPLNKSDNVHAYSTMKRVCRQN